MQHVLLVPRLMAVSMDEERRQYDEREELQKFGLPVFERRFEPRPDVSVRPEGFGGLLVLLLFGHKLEPPADCLHQPADDEQDRQRHAEAVVAP